VLYNKCWNKINSLTSLNDFLSRIKIFISVGSLLKIFMLILNIPFLKTDKEEDGW
jgi:hypothetical protein